MTRENKEDRGDAGLMMSKTGQRRLLWNAHGQLETDRHVWRELVSTSMVADLQTRDEIILGIPMGPVGPMGFPWEWESLG